MRIALNQLAILNVPGLCVGIATEVTGPPDNPWAKIPTSRRLGIRLRRVRAIQDFMTTAVTSAGVTFPSTFRNAWYPPARSYSGSEPAYPAESIMF